MAMTIGRAIGLRPSRGGVSRNGDQVTVNGWIVPTNGVNEIAAVRQQLLGMIGNVDEPIVPVTWAQDPTVDGFYTVTNAQVDTLGALNTGAAKFAVTMTQVPGYAQTQYAVNATCVTQSNALGIPVTAANGVVAIPGAVTEASKVVDATATVVAQFTSITTRPVGDSAGTLLGTMREAVGLTSGKEYFWRWFIAASQYYFGSCRVDVTRNGVTYPVVGREYDNSSAWTLTNGVIRCSVSSAGVLTVGRYTGTAWVSRDFTIGGSTNVTAGFTASPRMRILRNSPEQCTIRVMLSTTAVFGAGGTHLDITIRRGMPWIACNLDGDTLTDTWFIQPTTSTACTVATGGQYQTTIVAAMQFILASTAAQTNNTTTGQLRRTAANLRFPFVVAMASSSGVGPYDTAQDLIDRWALAVNEGQRVVSR